MILKDLMIDFTDVAVKPTVTKDEILSFVGNDESALFALYIPNLKLGKKISSPLRPDPDPSFNVYKREDGKIVFRDFSTDESGDIFSFVQRLFGVDFSGALKIISSDLNIKEIKANASFSPRYMSDKPNSLVLRPFDTTRTSDESSSTKIEITTQPYTLEDIEYWGSFGISIQTLHKYDVFSCKNYCITKSSKLTIWRSTGNPIYAFRIHSVDTIPRYKIYRPYASKRDKWRNNCYGNQLFGIKQAMALGAEQNYETLVITKGLKDVMTLHELGIPAIAPQSESTLIPKLMVNNLQKQWKKIVVIFDYDDTGVKSSLFYAANYGIPFGFVRDITAKDISDYYYYNESMEDTRKMVMKILAEAKTDIVWQN